jgi:uncharacterized protein (TIGR03437 family)
MHVRAIFTRTRVIFGICAVACALFGIFPANAFAADLTFTLNSTSGSGATATLTPDADPPCSQPNCVLFSGTLTDNDTDSSLMLIESIQVTFGGTNPPSGLTADNTFSFDVPGVLSGDPNYATDNSGNPANAYTGPIFGIDIAPGTPPGTYTATVTITAVGGTGDPNQNGFSVSQNITVTVTQIPQTIAFPAPLPVTLPANAFPLLAVATSDLPVAFASNSTDVCTVNGTLLTPIAAGTCSVTATQAGNTDYAAAPPVTRTFTINPASGGGGGGGAGGGGNPLTVSPTSVTIGAVTGEAAGTQTVTLSYPTFTQGAPMFSSNFSTNQGNGWLSVSPASGMMTQASFTNLLYTYTATITISANPNTAGINAGTYTGTVNFSAAGGIASEAVTMNVTSTPLPEPTGGIANAASAGQAPPSVVSPASYIAIYGSNLAANGNPNATSLPLPTTLNGAQVSLGGLPMPLLYASATQINAIVPQALASGSYPLLVTTGPVTSAPVSLTVTALQPGIYSVDESGSGAGIVTNAVTGQLVNASNPAHVGDYLVIYCTGLGPVAGSNGETEPSDGAQAPLSPVFHTTANVTVSIGGVSVPALFAGLTPTFAGLYQVNLQVPAGVAAGSSAPVTISATDPVSALTAKSNVVTIVVQ